MESPRAKENELLRLFDYRIKERSRSVIWIGPKGREHTHDDALRLVLESCGFEEDDGNVWCFTPHSVLYTRSGAVEFTLSKIAEVTKRARKRQGEACPSND